MNYKNDERVNMRRKYLSSEITEEVVGRLGNGIYLIGAEVGSGKTTLIQDVLIPKAISEGKKILIVAHRKSLVRQIAVSLGFNISHDVTKDRTFFEGVAKDEDGNIIDKITDEVRDMVCIATYQKIETTVKYLKNPKNWKTDKPISGGWSPYDYDYVACDEPHYIVTDASYNFNTIYSLQFLKSCNKKKAFLLTGTPRPLTYLDFGSHVDINVLRHPNYNIHNVKEIIISKQEYLQLQLVTKARNKEKAIVFVSSASVGVELRDKLNADGISAGFVCADNNYKSKDMDTDLRDKIIQEKGFDVQIAVLTSVMNTGISIEDNGIENVFMIGVFSPVEVQQSVARVRLGDKQGKVKLFISNASMRQHLAKMREYTITMDKNDLTPMAFADRYGQYNTIRGVVNTYEGDIVHPCYYAYCKMIVDDYNHLKDVGIFDLLKELFPNTPITSMIKRTVKNNLDFFLEKKLGEEDVFLEELIRGILAYSEELEEVINEIDGRRRAYDDLKKRSFKIGKAKFNKLLDAVESDYKIDSKRKSVDGKKITIWIVKKRTL